MKVILAAVVVALLTGAPTRAFMGGGYISIGVLLDGAGGFLTTSSGDRMLAQ